MIAGGRPVAGDDPIRRFSRWLAQARRRQVPLAEAMALATVGRNRRVSVRFVLLKQVDHRGFVFFTDIRSAKGQELARSPRAAAAFYWDRTGRQVRIEGPVEQVAPEEADAYWRTRPRQSQMAASASRQSAQLESRAALLDSVAALRVRFRGRAIARPGYWTGFRILPASIEFWTRAAYRLHRRELFVRRRGTWEKTLLQP